MATAYYDDVERAMSAHLPSLLEKRAGSIRINVAELKLSIS